MDRLTIYEILDFIHWLEPTLRLIKRNKMYMAERDEVFKVAGERIECLLQQIERDYNVTPPKFNAGEIEWLDKQYSLEDLREDKGK